MKNILEFIKDKSYYFLGGTVVIFILLIIIGSCSNGSGNSYEAIEENMVAAAEEYYSTRENRLPKEDGGSIKVTIGTLVEAELMKDVTDPSDSSKMCSGYVEVTKVGKEYSYLPFLTCKGNYEPKYLTDIVKSVKADEYGNGVYTINNELVYRGDDVNNYVSFNDQLWRIVKVDNEGDIKLVKATKSEETYPWDTAYNSQRQENVGVTSDYLRTDIRKILDDYYNDFDKNAKAKVVSKNLCVGKYAQNDTFSNEKECSVIKENEKVGLLNASDYQNASLSTGCTNIKSQECGNYNYLANSDEINTWLLNSSSENNYKVFYILNTINESSASSTKRINPVIYITNKSIIVNGNGTKDNPFVVK